MPDQTITEVAAAPEVVREQDKVMLILSYLGILALIPLLTVKDSDYVKWHAKNGLVLSLGGTILFIIIGWIPVVQLIDCLAGPALLVVGIMGIIKALNGIRWRIPLVTDIAEKL